MIKIKALIALIATVILAGLTTPAQAAHDPNGYIVCNSAYSVTWELRLTNVTISNYSDYVRAGECVEGDNRNGGLRVDPDYEGPRNNTDVDRYRIGGIGSCGSGYRDWVNNETIFNPPDAWANPCAGVRVHTDG